MTRRVTGESLWAEGVRCLDKIKDERLKIKD